MALLRLLSGRVTAAYGPGGVAAPWAAGFGGDPGGLLVGVAEHGGYDRCRSLEDELAQRGGAPVARGDARKA
jgi:hypothetical protein